MNVAIALASSSGQLSGVQRHAINLARCLLTRNEINQVHLIAAPWQLEFVLDLIVESGEKHKARLHVHAASIGNSALSRNLWFYRQLPRFASHVGADIVHLAYPVPVVKGAFRCPTVVTLHDLYPYDIPENFGFPKVLFNRKVLRHCLRAVDSITCVSQGTRWRLAKLDPQLALQKAVVIYNAVESQPQPVRLESPRPGLSGEPFLLCVAQHRRNKNVLLALRVFERILRANQETIGSSSLQMVVVGIPGPETPAIEHYIAQSGLSGRITLLNGISDVQLQWCYRNCLLLLAPSTIEGFGLPVAEALLAGCRVVCSDIPAFRELGGDSCHYVPLGPDAVEAFVDAIASSLFLERPRPVALPQLSFPLIADAYVRLYQSLLAAQSRTNEFSATPLVTVKESRPLGEL